MEVLLPKQGMSQAPSRKKLVTLGLPKDTVNRAAIVTYESETNIVSYARWGQIHLRVAADAIEIEATDQGTGIADIEQAMKEGFSTAPPHIREMGFGAGMGLSNMKKIRRRVQHLIPGRCRDSREYENIAQRVGHSTMRCWVLIRSLIPRQATGVRSLKNS